MNNPYPKYAGFTGRVRHAQKVFEKIGADPYIEREGLTNCRRFDNCFENGDGNAVVFALMTKATADTSGMLYNGIKTVFNGIPKLWQDIAANDMQGKLL